MSTSIFNQISYLRTSRTFPEDIKQFTVEVNKSYLDIAGAVNNRIIGQFPVTKPAVTGESWYILNNQKQQTLRQVYTFTNSNGAGMPISAINHGISVIDLMQFTRCWGTYTDETNSYGLVWANNSNISVGQITFYLTKTQIIFVVSLGSPALTRGRIILEWLSQP